MRDEILALIVHGVANRRSAADIADAVSNYVTDWHNEHLRERI